MNIDELRPVQRTEMKCRICGGFSSAQVCWSCSTSPASIRLATLEEKLREYLAEPSIDGRPVRQKLREELKKLITYETTT
jgi:hypothetical protein